MIVTSLTFTGTYHEEGIAIAYSKPAYPDEKPVPAYFRFDTVGVENDSIADFYLTGLLVRSGDDTIKRYRSTSDAMAALAAGEVMAVMGPKAQLEYGLTSTTDVHEPPLFFRWKMDSGYNPFCIQTYTVDDIIFSALQDGRMKAILTTMAAHLYCQKFAN